MITQNALSVRFVYAVEKEGKKSSKTAVGTAHLIRHHFDKDGNIVLDIRSMCGMALADIKLASKGDAIKDGEKNPLPTVCPDCQKAWKEAPDSPWRKFVGAEIHS